LGSYILLTSQGLWYNIFTTPDNVSHNLLDPYPWER
jgi:hypothetical protein